MAYNFYGKGKGLTDQLKEGIIDMLLTEHFETNLLPSESKIAARFGVSVPSVREALVALREEGVVTKKHGSGNYFHLSALSNNKNRLEPSNRYSTFLESNGYTVTESFSTPRQITASELSPTILNHCSVDPDEPLLHYERILYADGTPAIYCCNNLPLKLFKTVPEEFPPPIDIFALFWNCMGKEFAYGKVEHFALISTEEDRAQIGVEPGTPVLGMVSTFYSLEDLPISYNYIKFNPNYVTLISFER